MDINVCVPVYKNYEGLKKLIESCEAGTVKPLSYYIVDNGDRLNFEIPRGIIHYPGMNIGVARAWNWFIRTSPEIRLIVNDDILVGEKTLENIINNYTDEHICASRSLSGNTFSFYTVSDKVVEKVGLFDETISPNYAYYEDNDYSLRLTKAGLGVAIIECEVIHSGSETLKQMSNAEQGEHHRRFRLAQANYLRKWGGLPGREIFQTPYNK